MKKVTRIFTIAALAFGMVMAVSCKKDENGGGNTENLPTTLDENFDNGIPSTWACIDADGDGYKWIAISDGGFQQIPNWTPNGTNCAASASFWNSIGVLTPDNYLVSPKIYIEKGKKLTYLVCGSDDSDFAEHYDVLIGNFDGTTFTTIATVTSETLSQKEVQNREFSLDEWAGKSVYFAFRHYNCTNMYWLCIDNVQIQ